MTLLLTFKQPLRLLQKVPSKAVPNAFGISICALPVHPISEG